MSDHTPESPIDLGPDHDWLTRGQKLAEEEDAHQQSDTRRLFAIGDWLTEGVQKWNHEAYEYAAEIFKNHKRSTQRNLACVARAVKTSLRNDDLSWSHHAAVAKFEENPEIQKQLLDHASAQRLPLAKFKSHIDKEHPREKCDRPFVVTLRPPADIGEKLMQLALELGDEPDSAILRVVQWAMEQPRLIEILRMAA